MKVALVCGGRDFDDWACLRDELDALEPTMIVQGGARGADALAERWARERVVPCLRWPADWDYYHKAAGYKRNVAMAAFLGEMRDVGHRTLVVAFPGGKGTANMVEVAQNLSFKVIEACG